MKHEVRDDDRRARCHALRIHYQYASYLTVRTSIIASMIGMIAGYSTYLSEYMKVVSKSVRCTRPNKKEENR